MSDNFEKIRCDTCPDVVLAHRVGNKVTMKYLDFVAYVEGFTKIRIPCRKCTIVKEITGEVLTKDQEPVKL